ncbi:Gnt-II system L-idonate transporter [Posidoniimonas polymericola]|uniref:Gnt-II system L-idonate transporter n=1 Tax=Posidoniimonas polymericola TaxID=2528002 RepID=A0A5C5XUJ0_9BACT|nr:SLC13 family permease [Posidoniimonas polymericola]TWT66221.1 Gnt-II system L-idonate transporter [Posidoniimonas polymericola]
MDQWYPFLVLAIGLAFVIGGIVVLRVHAFLALISAALVVSLMAPGEWGDKVPRVAAAFGDGAMGLGVVIAMAAIIGKAMAESGAADRVVRVFLHVLGENRGATAIAASGYVVAIPVFFDTVFYLLIPLVRSMSRRTGGHYVKYLVAAAACASAHALVPPTPGPLFVANAFDVNLATMMMVGLAVSAPSLFAALAFAGMCDRTMNVDPPDDIDHDDAEVFPVLADDQLPSIAWSLAPILLPVTLITTNAIINPPAPAVEGEQVAKTAVQSAMSVLGNPDLALLLAAIAALVTQRLYRRHSLTHLATSVEHALMSGGVIVLITAAGGAFGRMLREAQIGDAIQDCFGGAAFSGAGLLLLAFGVASLMKFAQGSSTVAMITAAGMVAAMLKGATLHYHPVYLATAIGSGSLVGSWMNDSGFWIFAKMGGLTELQALKTWTPLLAILGVVSMAMTLLMAAVAPMTE